MKNRKFVLSVMIILTVLSCCTMVFAESYSSTLSVSSQWDGAGRTYSTGTQLHCNCYDTYLSTPFTPHTSDKLYIQAQKNDFLWIFYHNVGSEVSKTVYSNSFTNVYSSFPMEGSGQYRFRFTKRDVNWGGQEAIKSDNVQMSSN